MSRGSLICSICYEELKPAFENLQSISICGHVFHERCLQRWFIYSSAFISYNCPICRKSCVKEHAIRLYFQSGEDQCGREAKDCEAKILLGKLSEISSSFTRDQPKEIKNMVNGYRGNGRPVSVLPSYRKYEELGTTSARPGGTEQHAAAVGGCVIPSTSNVEVSNKRKGADPRNSGLDIRNCKGSRISNPALQTKEVTVPQTDDPYSEGRCITIINGMQGVDSRLHNGAVHLFQNREWRKMFLLMESGERLNWLKFMLPSA